MRDASDLNRELLEGGHSSVAGRLAGALRASGRGEFADNILATMRAAGYVVNETNPFSVAPPTLDEVTIMHSYLFKGATVVDGASSPPFRADVALEGDRIALIAPRINSPASKVIDADGLILAPGFIDIHSHTDATIFKHPLAESKVSKV